MAQLDLTTFATDADLALTISPIAGELLLTVPLDVVELRRQTETLGRAERIDLARYFVRQAHAFNAATQDLIGTLPLP